MTTLYPICPQVQWEQAQAQGEYSAPSLAAEGFIHCSTQSQVAATADLFFRGQDGLVLLVIDRTRIAVPVRDDDIGGGRRFPHIYGPLNLDAVTEARLFPPAADGTFAAPL